MGIRAEWGRGRGRAEDGTRGAVSGEAKVSQSEVPLVPVQQARGEGEWWRMRPGLTSRLEIPTTWIQFFLSAVLVGTCGGLDGVCRV